jgi:hypothetical protein
VLYRTDTGAPVWASGALVPKDKVGSVELQVREEGRGWCNSVIDTDCVELAV